MEARNEAGPARRLKASVVLDCYNKQKGIKSDTDRLQTELEIIRGLDPVRDMRPDAGDLWDLIPFRVTNHNLSCKRTVFGLFASNQNRLPHFATVVPVN
jgi:hypothetical protein